MFLGFEDEPLFLTVTEDVFKWVPSGYRILLQAGHLRVLRVSPDQMCLMDFHSSKTQPGGITKEHSEIELEGPWQEVQGSGTGILLANWLGKPRYCTQACFVAFYNNDTRRHLEHPNPTVNLKQTSTDMMVERKGLFGSKQVPFVHTDQSLGKLVRDVVDLYESKYYYKFYKEWEAMREYEARKSGGSSSSGRL